MKDLLEIEWLKIKRYRTFWILIGLFLALLFLWNYEASLGNIVIGNTKKNQGISIINADYSFPQGWTNTAYWASIFIMFISIVVIILTTNEYGYRTNRQNVIDGWSRMRFYHAKVLMVFVLSGVMTLAVLLVGAILGFRQLHSFHGFLREFYQLGYFFLLSLDYLGFALLLALLVRRSGLAIGLFLLYSLFVESILKWIINSHLPKQFGNLLPLQASDELIPFPLPAMLKTMIQSAPSFSNTTYIFFTGAWCAVYYFAGRALLLRRDW